MALKPLGNYLDRADVLIIDVETTGFDIDSEIVEISVVDTMGETRFNSLVMPKADSIPQGAIDVHGITIDMLKEKGAPRYDEIASELRDLLAGATVIWSYNAEFDMDAFHQTEAKYEREIKKLGMPEFDFEFDCMMLHYAEWRNEPSPYYEGEWMWHKLMDAVVYETGCPFMQTHRALGDCRLVLKLIRRIDQKQSEFKVSHYVWAFFAVLFFLWLVL